MENRCVAVDIGASSGRLILSQYLNGKLHIKEIHRFKNQMIKRKGHFYWDVDYLYNQIVEGLSKVSSSIDSIGIDTWAIDYVLIDEEGHRISEVYAYRDHRTDNTMVELLKKYSKEKIYKKTGIQFLPFNTLYQLIEHHKNYSSDFDKAKHLLFIPDYLNYRLTNIVTNEFTNCTTSQLFNISKSCWDDELIELTNVPNYLFKKPISPGTIIGNIKKELENYINQKNIKVIAPATHDTGSAVAAIPADDENFAYISSGTWSLMGIESNIPLCTDLSLKYNFTNEGGVNNTFRVLKNIMGLWLIQEVKRLYKDKYSFAELVELAKEEKPFKSIINPNNQRFMNPDNMIEEIKNYCRETDQIVPETPGEIARCIFESLAFQYKDVLIKLREVSTKKIEKIFIVGGGCQNEFLNQLCANFTQCTVYAGPVEATAIGNVLVQHIALGHIDNLETGRRIIKNSFEIKQYNPDKTIDISEIWNLFRKLP